MSAKLAELTEKLAAKRKELAAIFEKYPDLDMPEDVAEEIKRRNDELTDLGKEFERLRAAEEIARKNAEELDRLERPAGRMVHANRSDGTDLAGGRKLKSLGELFVESDAYKLGIKAAIPRFGVDIPEHTLKALVEALSFKTVMTTSAGFAPEAVRSDVVVLSAQRRPVVASLIPQSTTTLNAIRYMEETTFTNNAGPAAEGSAVGEAALAYTERTVPVETIGTFIPVTKQQLEDVEGIQDLINQRLTLMVLLAEENQLLNGNGTSPQLQGFYNKSGVQTQAKGADATPDAIFKAMTKVRHTGMADVTGIILHPNDWQEIRLLRTADGVYIWGSPAEPGPERIWGVPVIATSAATEGTGLLGDFQLYAHISRRQGIQIEVSDSHSDYFVKNQLAIRAVERLSLEIYRPSAFCTVTDI